MTGPRTMAAFALVLFTTAACTVGPNYRRPVVTTPDAYRGQQAGSVTSMSLGDERWWTVFVDPQLQALIKTALANNYDVQIAASRILQAEAQLGIIRSDQFPSVTAGATVQQQRGAQVAGQDPATTGVGHILASVTWELDFWGRYRRATESGRAQLLATRWGARAVTATLVSQVASSYFTLRALDLELEISRRTLESRRESLQLTEVLEGGGATSLVDVRQAEQLVYGASAAIVDLERRIAQLENFIQILLGSNPADVARGGPLVDQPHAPELPAGLPSALLARRPDIQQAEQQLIAANAEIGVARSAYFPQIALTGSGGFASTALATLFSGPAGIWAAAASVAQPIFTGGRIRSEVALAEARYLEAMLSYRQTVQQAFREVADALVGYQRAREFRSQLQLLARAATDARRLADVRYQGGATGYLEVLDSDTRLFEAELGLAEAHLAELDAYVEVYRALGGGWEN